MLQVGVMCRDQVGISQTTDKHVWNGPRGLSPLLFPGVAVRLTDAPHRLPSQARRH